MVAEAGAFDGFELGKGLAELAEEFVHFVGDVLSSFVMVGTQQDVAFQKNLWVIPPASAEQGVAQRIGTWEEDGGGKSEGGNRVFGVSPLTVLAGASKSLWQATTCSQ